MEATLSACFWSFLSLYKSFWFLKRNSSIGWNEFLLVVFIEGVVFLFPFVWFGWRLIEALSIRITDPNLFETEA